MTVDLKNSLRVDATLVSNDFIDIYMASASGEYVKEYLFLLRHQAEEITVSMIADALNHTESDVNRALAYWRRAGVLRDAGAGGSGASDVGTGMGKVRRGDGNENAGSGMGSANVGSGTGDANAGDGMRFASINGKTGMIAGRLADAGFEGSIRGRASEEAACADGTMPALGSFPPRRGNGNENELENRSGDDSGKELGNRIGNGSVNEAFSVMAGRGVNTETGSSVLPSKKDCDEDGKRVQLGEGQSAVGKEARSAYPPERIGTLVGDEDFSQLLYIAQKYMNKVFTQMECEVFAYLYDGLKMTAELLEYVVEYCVQSGHTSIRYIETVAINWYESGIKTVEEAKSHASSFTKDSFSVMKAFGLNDRKPGDSEWEMIERWFKSYGFSRELVLEACNRTIAATHSPSFKYADKILSGWKKAGAHTLEDVKRLDQQHEGRTKGKSGAVLVGKPSDKGRGRRTNQFQNFPQRDIDYDALVLKQLTES